jgi:hypothetical protein
MESHTCSAHIATLHGKYSACDRHFGIHCAHMAHGLVIVIMDKNMVLGILCPQIQICELQ